MPLDRPVPWERASCLHLELADGHFDELGPISPDAVSQMLTNLAGIGRMAIHGTLADLAAHAQRLIRANRGFIEDPTTSPVLSLPRELHAASNKKLHGLMLGSQDPDRLREACAAFSSLVDKPLLVMTSDSHAATGWMLRELRASGEWDFDGTAMLSFDHHLDMADVRGELDPAKENVWSYLLSKQTVKRVGVVGVSSKLRATDQADAYMSDVDILRGDRLCPGGIPSESAYEHALGRMLDEWRQRGFRAVYPSIDLDGLACDTEQLTATDYNPITGARRLFAHGFAQLLARTLEQYRFDPYNDLSPWWSGLSGIEAGLALEMHSDKGAYCGLPSRWISRALEMTRERGFPIGLRNTRTNQVFVGDVTEYCGSDFQGRTARTACDIAGELLRSCAK